MIWRLFRRNKEDVASEDDTQVEELEQELEVQKEKLAETRAKVPDLARATASARRVHYRVDQFTEEISKTFGIVNHG